MLGALIAINLLPLSRKILEEIIGASFPSEQAQTNLKAFAKGIAALEGKALKTKAG